MEMRQASLRKTESRLEKLADGEMDAVQFALPRHGESVPRLLHSRSCGTQPAKRTRKLLHMYGYAGYQQLAGWIAGGADSGTGQAAITSISISGGMAAFVQTNGVLSLYGMGLLQQDADVLSHRSKLADHGPCSDSSIENEAQAQGSQAYMSGLGQPNSEDEEEGIAGDSSKNRNSDDNFNLGGHSAGAWLNYGTRVRSHRRANNSRAWAAAQARRDHLPAGGARFSMLPRLDDVAWDPHVPHHIAIAGAASCNVQVINVEEGRRKRMQLAPKQIPTTSYGYGLTSVKYFSQGPYTVAAAGRNNPKVLLWDQRRSPLAVAELVTPGQVPLQAPIEISADGTVLYGVTGDNQLLMWDVRKSSQGSGVLHFGSSGPFHHALLGSLDMNGPLVAAQAEHLTSPQSDAFAGSSLSSVPTPPPIDQVLVNPHSPSRLGLVLQNCGSAVLDLGSGKLTHSCLPPNVYHSTRLTAPSRYFWVHKRGTWDPQGHTLWVPHAWLPQDPQPQPQAPTNQAPAPHPHHHAAATTATRARLQSLSDLAGRSQQQQPQQQQQPAAAAAQQGAGGIAAPQAGSEVGGGNAAAECATQPCIAAIDCREGGTRITGRGTQGAASTAHAGDSNSTAREEQSRACVLRRPLSVHQLGAFEPPELTAALQLLSRSFSRFAADPDDAFAAADVAYQRAAAASVREAVYRPSITIPVTDWITCVTCDPIGGTLLAGSYEAELLLLNHATTF